MGVDMKGAGACQVIVADVAVLCCVCITLGGSETARRVREILIVVVYYTMSVYNNIIM